MYLFIIIFSIFSADINSVFGTSSKEEKTSTSTSVFGSNKEASSSQKESSKSVFGTSENNDNNEKVNNSKSVFSQKSNKKSIKNALSMDSAFIWPIKDDFTLTSSYGWRSSKKFHDGIDLTAKEDTKILATRAGKIIYSDSRIGGYGNMILIKHSGNMYSVYAHNKKNLIGKGIYVKQGEEIAVIGNTGRSTGRHLHFEIRKGKYSVNPMKYLKK